MMCGGMTGLVVHHFIAMVEDGSEEEYQRTEERKGVR